MIDVEDLKLDLRGNRLRIMWNGQALAVLNLKRIVNFISLTQFFGILFAFKALSNKLDIVSNTSLNLPLTNFGIIDLSIRLTTNSFTSIS